MTIHPRRNQVPTVGQQQPTGILSSPILTLTETKHTVTTPLIVPTSQVETRKENKLIVRSEEPTLQEKKSSVIITTASTSISTSTEASTAITSIPERSAASQIASVRMFSPSKKQADHKQTKQPENPPSSCCIIL